MAKGTRISEQQFNKITKQLYAALVSPTPKDAHVTNEPQAEPTDCEALLAFIEAAQEIYTRDCPGA